MFPYEDVMNENGLADKPVLLSYRSQQLLLMCLTKMENRYNWLDMDDATWDELESYIAETETEILTEVIMQPAIDLLPTTRITTTQTLLAANSPNAIIWNFGNFTSSDPTRIPMPVDGFYSLTANVRVTSAVATVWTFILRMNGLDEIFRINYPSNAAQQLAMAWNFRANAGEYAEVLIAHTTNSTLQITTPIPTVNLLIAESP